MTSSESTAAQPMETYKRRLAERETRAALLTRRELTFSHLRTLTALAALAAAAAALGAHWISGWWSLAPIMVFPVLMVFHDRAIRARAAAVRGVDFYDAGVRRLENRWMGRGNTRADFPPRDHAYAADLDLFGRGSLFELLCSARTRTGESTLADWLLKGARPDAVLDRQEAVRELAPKLDFREQLAVLAEEAASDPGALLAWANMPAELRRTQVRFIATALAVLGVAAAAAWWPGDRGPWLLLPVLLGGLILRLAVRANLTATLKDLAKTASELTVLSQLLRRLEEETYSAPLLRRLRAELGNEAERPSAAIARLRSMLDWYSLRESVILQPIAILVLWQVHWAFAFAEWRAKYGSRLGDWLRVCGEIEALSALAGFTYERPEYTFPQFVMETPMFAAAQMGHPLLPAGSCVRNEIVLDADHRIYIVSGSNMSGKSTLLRAIGVNSVLAHCGAPVCAGSLRLSPLQIGASLRTQDSLQGGISRFYAEVLRLRQVVSLAGGDPPLLFLLDEILHGTNSHDRAIGAEAIARTLRKRGAIGLITTHDLALAALDADPDIRAVNVHFEDQLLDGKMSFDYHLRPGMVTRSNALELMRAVGLDV